MTEGSKSTVVALFRTHEDAELGVNTLVQAGFPASEIGFLSPGEASQPEFGKSAAAGVGGGAVLGAIAGGLLGAASMVVAPGIGPIVTAGAWLPPLMGVVTGGAAGGTAGGLFSMAATGDQGLHFRQQVEAGRSLVNLTTDRPREARAALEAAAALEVADLGGSSETAEQVIKRDDEPAG